MNIDDSVTYKMKKKKNNGKENISNSSRDSLEKEILSYGSNIISKTGSSKGEEIKFNFNPPSSQTMDKKSKSLFSCKTIRKSKENEKDEKNVCNFKDILINYMNSPQIKSKKLNEDKEDRRKSIIYEKPDMVLTLHGEDDSNENNSEKSDKNNDSISNSNSNSNSDSNSNSNSSNSDSFNLNNVQGKIYSKNSESSKDRNNLDNSKESTSFKFDMNKYKDSSHNSDIEEKNSNSGTNIIFENYKNEDNENENENEKEYNKMILNELKKIQNPEKYNIRRESYNNSRRFKNAYTNTNSFTTTTNTHNTQKTQKTNNSSFQSIQLNNKKVKYNYLCWNDLSLQKKLLIKNRSNSVKKIESFKDESKGNSINDKTEIMIYKLKHLNISLDKEKSYFYYFRNFSNLKEQANNYTQKSSDNLNNNNDEEGDSNYNEQFFYPNEFYISKKNSLHIKTHISNLFDKLRQHNNNC